MAQVINRYAGICSKCASKVEPGEGLAVKGRTDTKWTILHTVCPDSTADPVEPSSRVVDFSPTPEQERAVELFLTGEDLVIQAGAGAGKTSTLRLLAEAAKAEGRKGVFTAFNTKIVKSSAGKFPGNVRCATSHSLAFNSTGAPFRGRLDSARVHAQVLAQTLGISALTVQVDTPEGKQPKTLAAGFLANLVQESVRRFCSSTDNKIGKKHIPRVDAIDPEGKDTNNRKVANHLLSAVLKSWEDVTTPEGTLPYRQFGGHSIYFKVWAMGSPVIDCDFLMVDEGQDTDRVFGGVIEYQKRFGTQIVIVGDSQQEIYSWRGAVDALGRLEALGGNVTYLTQSFRFGQAVADVANGLLERIGAPLRISGFSEVASTVGPVAEPNCILTRTNAGAIKAVLEALESGRKPHLVGGGGEVKYFAECARELMETGSTNHHDLGCFSSWSEVQEYSSQDEGSDLRLLVKLIDDFGVDKVLAAVSNSTPENYADVVVCTAHKSKGLEWDSVQLAGDFEKPKDEGVDVPVEALRLLYVAITRAKLELDITNMPHITRGA